jgi:phosphate transport system substrate-binding protein
MRCACHHAVIRSTYNNDATRLEVTAASFQPRINFEIGPVEKLAQINAQPTWCCTRKWRWNDVKPAVRPRSVGSFLGPSDGRKHVKRTFILPAVIAGALVAAATSTASAIDVTGAGATFPYPIYAKWADSYKKETGVGLNYQSIGSGGGIKQIEAKTVVFGGTDAPLSADELNKNALVQFPMVMGGIVPVVNLDGVSQGSLVFDGPTLAKVFLGQVKSWDDPAIKALNPGVTLPRQAIAVVHRADGSGTTFNFTDYLAKVSPDWKSKVGSATAVEWPVGIGAKGNEGVANNVAQTRGSIGYVEYAYAKQNKLNFTKMINKDGKTVAPVSDTFQAAAANADWNSVPGYGVILSNQPGAQSWPMTAATFILIHKQPKDGPAAAEALKFFAWAYAKGGKMAEELDFVPMPASVVSAVEGVWTKEIKDASGKPLFAATR